MPHVELPRFGGRYLAVHKLAEGGMAEVFLARDVGVSPPRLCVVKRILPAQARNPDYLRMFSDEARVSMTISHPNVVRVWELGKGPSGPFLVMEYLAGQDLFDLVRRSLRQGRYLPWELAVQIVAEAAEGVHHAHGLKGADGAPLNIIHRDLTPSNIFVTWDGLVKVLDFGIASAEQRMAKTEAGLVKGKAQYLAPEQITGKPLDGRVDQFALGAVLYELLAGRVMFAADNELAALTAILERARPLVRAQRPDVPDEVDGIIQKAVSIDADRRYPSLREMAQALVEALPAPLSREQVASLVQDLFPAEFEIHAELMGRLSTADTEELRTLYRGVRAHDPGVRAADAEPLALPATDPAVPTLAFGPPAVELPPTRTTYPRPGSVGKRALPVGPLSAGAALAVVVVVIAGLGMRRSAPPLRGSITVRSEPPGATVSIDGQPSIWTTPFVIPHLALGRHRVELSFPQRESHTAEVELTESALMATVDATLRRLTGKLLVQVRPHEVLPEIIVDGQPVAPGSPLVDVTSGEPHQVRVSARGYQPAELSVQVEPGAVSQVDVDLQPSGVDPEE